jgi:hypothetical protein
MSDIEIEHDRLKNLLASGEIDMNEYNRELKELEQFYEAEEECPMCGRTENHVHNI